MPSEESMVNMRVSVPIVNASRRSSSQQLFVVDGANNRHPWAMVPNDDWVTVAVY